MNDTEQHFEEGKEAAPPGTRAMSIVRWLLVAGAGLAAVLSVADHLRGAGQAEAHASATVYTCPMHPKVVEEVPGQCPICNMSLVAKRVEEAAGDESDVEGLAPIELTPDRVQLAGMRTAAAERRALDNVVRAVGFVAPNEAGLAIVDTRFAGWIEALHVAKTGEKVRRGQVLATIYSPELFTAQHELLAAKKWENNNGALVDDARRRLELLGISPEDIEAVERAGKPRRALELRAPASGFVTKKNAVQGMYVQPGAALFELADLSEIWVLADLYEGESTRVAVGAPAELTTAALPGRTFRGRVELIYPTVDPESRTVRARVALPNRDGALKPAMYGDVSITLESAEVLTIPREALIETGEARYVFLALDGGRFEPRRVRVGARTGERIEIREGLEEGDVVVTTASFLIDSESRLRATLRGGHD